MEQEQYGEAVARLICILTGLEETLEVRTNGVYVAEEYAEFDPIHAFWSPVWEMDWRGAPDPLTAPSLPIPFTANELAAFMLDGVGCLIQDRFGSIAGGPDGAQLDNLGPRCAKVREALREAYASANLAQQLIGPPPHEAERLAHKLSDEWENANGLANTREGVFEPSISLEEASERRARAKASVTALHAKMEQAQAQARARRSAWRKAMVAQLLAPPAPRRLTEEPIKDRNARWLAVWDEEKRTGKAPGAQADAIRRIVEAEGVTKHAAKAGLQAAEKARAESYREGGSVPIKSGRNTAHDPFNTGNKRRRTGR